VIGAPYRRFRSLMGPAAGVLLTLLVIGACAPQGNGSSVEGPPGFFPPPGGTAEGRSINQLYDIVFWIAVAVFLLVEGLIVWSVLRYRRRDDRLPEQTHGNFVMEVVWTAIPAIIVGVLFVMSMQTLARVEARSPNPAVTVDVKAFQWQWTFEYPAQELSFTGLGATGPEMVIPVGEPVHVRLESNDVIHSWYVPLFLYKEDVVPGRVNEFDLLVSEPGVYTGQCAEFCGLAHAQMFFTVRAVTPAEFDEWVAAEQEKARQSPPPPPPSPSGGGGPPPPQIQASATNSLAFDQATLEGSANVPLTILFENRDPAAPHNVAIKNATPEGDFIGQPIAQPGATETYTTPPLQPGDYEFFCSVHPNMTGTLQVH
jgi:cytochrome c oxidase subunit 2